MTTQWLFPTPHLNSYSSTILTLSSHNVSRHRELSLKQLQRDTIPAKRKQPPGSSRHMYWPGNVRLLSPHAWSLNWQYHVLRVYVKQYITCGIWSWSVRGYRIFCWELFGCAETHGHGVVCADFGIWYMEHVYPQEWYKLGKAWCENEWTWFDLALILRSLSSRGTKSLILLLHSFGLYLCKIISILYGFRDVYSWVVSYTWWYRDSHSTSSRNMRYF